MKAKPCLLFGCLFIALLTGTVRAQEQYPPWMLKVMDRYEADFNTRGELDIMQVGHSMVGKLKTDKRHVVFMLGVKGADKPYLLASGRLAEGTNRIESWFFACTPKFNGPSYYFYEGNHIWYVLGRSHPLMQKNMQEPSLGEVGHLTQCRVGAEVFACPLPGKEAERPVIEQFLSLVKPRLGYVIRDMWPDSVEVNQIFSLCVHTFQEKWRGKQPPPATRVR